MQASLDMAIAFSNLFKSLNTYSQVSLAFYFPSKLSSFFLPYSLPLSLSLSFLLIYRISVAGSFSALLVHVFAIALLPPPPGDEVHCLTFDAIQSGLGLRLYVVSFGVSAVNATCVGPGHSSRISYTSSWRLQGNS
ncbi:Hypothetical predicted protein [Octopus vulgaris]|uniref:Uncharacterized protein n=1 Tax=Octopus vulgaris TaxID=6645 RepID=A0AA36BDZ3_OCTVU|nr:Hypothetical predicted protein [Octopus vulgaris]